MVCESTTIEGVVFRMLGCLVCVQVLFSFLSCSVSVWVFVCSSFSYGES